MKCFWFISLLFLTLKQQCVLAQEEVNEPAAQDNGNSTQQQQDDVDDINKENTELDPDLCRSDSDCSNGATCRDSHCFCVPPHWGPKCQQTCPCQNGGTCNAAELQQGDNSTTTTSTTITTCRCNDNDWTGDLCDIPVVQCPDDAVECLNGGTCVIADKDTDTYGCQCPDGFSGYNCQHAGGSTNNNNNSDEEDKKKNVLQEIGDLERSFVRRLGSDKIFGIFIVSAFGLLAFIYCCRLLARRGQRRQWNNVQRESEAAFDPRFLADHDTDIL